MLEKGQVLGDRYQLQQKLSEKLGRQSWRAITVKKHRVVFVKCLEFGCEFQWDDLKLLEREAQVLKHLKHPDIPRFLDYFEINSSEFNGFVFVQTYITANSLENHLQSGRTFSEAEIQEIAQKLLEILIYLHGCKPPIVHRDIKPSHIMVGNRSGHSSGQVYLVGFGAVQNFAAPEKGTSTLVGSYEYTPDEHYRGQSVPASDVYSAGVSLVYAIAGVQPTDLPRENGRIPLDRIAQVSPGFSRWLNKMTASKLDKRFSSAQIALEELRRVHEIEAMSEVAKKPFDTKLVLTKDADELQILIPPTGFKLCSLFGCLLFTAFSIPFLAFLFLPFIGWIVVGFLFWSVMCAWKNFIFELFKQTRLGITEERIELTYKIFGLRFNQVSPSAREDILKIERIEPHIKREQDSEGGYYYKSVPASIVVWAGNQSYELSNLTVPELDWLCYELSDWLGLSVKQRRIPVLN